ncbi:MAG: hypothetical protein ACRDWW_10585 [Acidimicrobiales bacterium]
MGRRRVRIGNLLGVPAFAAVLAAGCSATHAITPPVTLAAPATPSPATSTTTTTVAAPTTTAPWGPTALQPSPFAASTRLVQAWAAGDREAAGTIASPPAVAALFASAYPAGNLQSRGCTQGANPGTCTYRNTVTNGIYEIGVTDGPGGWYVSSVTPES